MGFGSHSFLVVFENSSYLEIVLTVLPIVDTTVVDTVDDIQDCLPEWVSMGLAENL